MAVAAPIEAATGRSATRSGELMNAETGREPSRSGLLPIRMSCAIPWGSPPVWVRFPPPAPINTSVLSDPAARGATRRKSSGTCRGLVTLPHETASLPRHATIISPNEEGGLVADERGSQRPLRGLNDHGRRKGRRTTLRVTAQQGDPACGAELRRSARRPSRRGRVYTPCAMRRPSAAARVSRSRHTVSSEFRGAPLTAPPAHLY